jgi:hypothetical protein
MKFTDYLREVAEDCNCNKKPISEGLQYHIDNQKLLTENVYRPFSKKYFELFKEARELYRSGELILTEEEEKLIKNTDLGEFGYYNGIKVPLDFPMSEEQLMEAKAAKKKQPPLNKPKRGGSKKFYVYVRKPGGGIKKVSFGDTSGLKAKINDPKARKSFAARHKCAQNKDRTSAGYWACRLPRYASMLGLKSSFTGYW